jgi:inner membrane protein
MPTVFSHAAVPLALGLALGSGVVSRRLLVAGVAASAIPDLDVLAFRFGVPYADAWGHRGASHSLAFAVLLEALAMVAARALRTRPGTAFLFIAMAAASHGLLDMLTNGGQGVALWWPLSSERLFFPWQVVEASPLSLRRLASGRGVDVLVSELRWIGLPAIALAAAAWIMRRSVSVPDNTHHGHRQSQTDPGRHDIR